MEGVFTGPYPCHALHENTLGWLIFGEMVESLHTCCWGFSRIHAEHTSVSFQF